MTEYSKLWITVTGWATAQGAEGINKLPGLWTGATPEYEVSLNGHNKPVDDVPPFNCRLIGTKHLTVAIVGPSGGGVYGATEDELLNHFEGLS